MKKYILFFAIITLSACTGDHKVHWVDSSFTQALDLAREQNKPILVDFFSPT